MKRIDPPKKKRVIRKRGADIARRRKDGLPARTELVRADDLLNLQVQFDNLRIDFRDGEEEPVLVIKNTQQSAFLTFIFPPQTIAETAVFESSKVSPEGDPKRPDPDVVNDTPDETLFVPGTPGDHASVSAEIGQPSRLVFKVPAKTKIPFSIQGLLDWTKLELSVNGIAAIDDEPTVEQIANAPAIMEPAATDTAIELPYRLVISPTAEVAWLHRADAFTSRGQTELWHTRLALKTAGGPVELTPDQPAPLRAIWSPDFDPKKLPQPQRDPNLGRTAMDNNDRHQIVVLTSAFHGYEVDVDFHLPIFERSQDVRMVRPIARTVSYVPQPFHAEELMLSALGGWMRSRGSWIPPRPTKPVSDHSPRFDQIYQIFKDIAIDVPVRADENIAPQIEINRAVIGAFFQPDTQSLDLSEWVHVAAQGRDHYVRIVYEGELWPFRNRAALIKVTERKFEENNGIVAAYLMQRMFIVVREPEKTFATTDRGNPFKRVRLTTLVTPDIAIPKPLTDTIRTFWVKVNTGAPPAPGVDPPSDYFKFHAVGYDVEGNAVDFTVPMLFVSKSDFSVSANTQVAVAEYNKKDNIGFRACAVPGQKVMLAERDAAKPNDNTQLVTDALNFVMDKARVQPTLLKASVRIPQVRELLGADLATSIRLLPDYLSSGFNPVNKTGVFAQVVDQAYSELNPVDLSAGLAKLQVDINADQAGGFATPNLGVSTLSRALGPLAGKVEDAIADNFDPTQFFPKNGAMLFGVFDLFKLLMPTTVGENAPKMRTEMQDVGGGAKVLLTSFDWKPAIQDVDLVIAKFSKHNDTQLDVTGTIRKPINPAALGANDVTSVFTGTLNHFQVSVLKSVFINFVKFSFTKKTKEKVEVVVKLDPNTPVEFGGDLKFVEEIRQAIPSGLFGDGASLDLVNNPLGIRAAFGFALPPLTVGVFTLKDVKLGAALTLPFLEGKPTFDFNISERPHPFLLAVAIFGGGGFFHLQLDTAGMKELEVALEFGATAALDIGVASGEVHIMAGIYFSLQRKEGSTDLAAVLSGYLRMGGSLNVLGLIKVSVEFNLTFTYDGVRDKAYGRATLTVHVEVLFFSASVELTVERAFGGSGDPHFIDFFPSAEPWSEYALAFA